MTDYKQEIEEILAGLSNYIVESIHLQPTPVEMQKLNQKQATQALTTLINNEKIAELEKLAQQYCEVRDETTGKRIDLKAVTLYRIKDRIATLKNNGRIREEQS